jgi:hypothetical protein
MAGGGGGAQRVEGESGRGREGGEGKGEREEGVKAVRESAGDLQFSGLITAIHIAAMSHPHLPPVGGHSLPSRQNSTLMQARMQSGAGRGKNSTLMQGGRGRRGGGEGKKADLETAQGGDVVGYVSIGVVQGEGGGVGRQAGARGVQLRVRKHPEVGAIKHPLRLDVHPGQETVALPRPVYHLVTPRHAFRHTLLC